MAPLQSGNGNHYNYSSGEPTTLTSIKSRSSAISRAVPCPSTKNDHHALRRPAHLDPKYSKRNVSTKEGRYILVMIVAALGLLTILLCVLLILLVTSNENPKLQIPSLPAKAASLLLPHQRLRSSHQDLDQHPAFLALSELEEAMQKNLYSDHPLNPELLIPLDRHQPNNPLLTQVQPKSNTPKFSMHGQFFRTSRLTKERMEWQLEWDRIVQSGHVERLGPLVDYTQDHLYQYPPKEFYPPSSGYPKLRPLKEIFQTWPQHVIDHPPNPIQETLQHFDYQTELDAALRYRQRKLPFKLVHVPELLQARKKWTDEYISQQFDSTSSTSTAQGKCQESRNSFFAFFLPTGWNVEHMGLPPTRNNDFTFSEWSRHAHYADTTQLDAHRPHFYWQVGVTKEERERPPATWSFVSRDLPSFSSPNPNFLCPDPAEQKGIQCRFGERGLTTATHFDAGQNMVGMIEGAKRYILHPPKECSRLGIVTSRNSAIFRHSLLNFAHLTHPPRSGVSRLEQQWLHRAAQSRAVETVLKAGEILFIPSHWFHYIVGLQKNAQCNVRSGVDIEGDEEFGGARHVSDLQCDPRNL